MNFLLFVLCFVAFAIWNVFAVWLFGPILDRATERSIDKEIKRRRMGDAFWYHRPEADRDGVSVGEKNP